MEKLTDKLKDTRTISEAFKVLEGTKLMHDKYTDKNIIDIKIIEAKDDYAIVTAFGSDSQRIHVYSSGDYYWIIK